MADARHQKRLRRTQTSPSKSLFGAGNTEKLPSQMSTSGRSRSSLAIFRVSLHGAWPKRRKRHMRGNIEEEWLSLGEQWPTQESDLGTFLRKKPVETGGLGGARRPIRGRFRQTLTEKYGGSDAPLSSVSLWGFQSKLAPSMDPGVPFEVNFAIN